MAPDAAGQININRLRTYLRDEVNKALENTDLRNNHVPILTAAHNNPGLSITKLAHAIGLDKSTVTRNVQQLSEMGYVDHRGDPCKVNEIYLTEKGIESAEYLEKVQGEAYRNLLNGFDEKEKAELVRMMLMVEKNLADLGY